MVWGPAWAFTPTQVKLVTQEVRRKALSKIVKKADPHVQVVVDQLQAYANEQQHMIDKVLGTLIRNLTEDMVSETAQSDVFRCQLRCETQDGSPCELPKGMKVGCDAPYVRRLLAATSGATTGWLLERQNALKAFHTALEAFGKAHATLAQDADNLGKNDSKHLKDIIKTVKDIYDKALKATGGT